MSRKELYLLITLAVVNFANIVDFMIMMPLGDQLMAYFHVGPQAFSVLVSAYTLSATVSGLLGTIWLDKMGRKKSMLLLYAGFLLGTFSCGIAPTYYSLLAARVLTGAFGGVLASLIFAIVGDVVPMERRGQAMGIVTSSFSVASILGVPLGLILAAKFSWHAPFFALVAFGLPFFAFLIWQLPPLDGHLAQGHQNTHPFVAFQNAFAQPKQRHALLFMFVMVLGHFMVIPFIAPTLIANVGLTQDELSYMYLVGGLSSVIASPIIGSMSDRFGKDKIFRIFLFLSIIPMLLITNLGQVSLMMVLILSGIFFVISGGRFIPAQAIVTGVVDPHERGRFMSLLSAMQHLGTSLATLIAGAIITKNANGHLDHYATVGLVASALFIVTYFMFLRLKKEIEAPIQSS